MQTPCSGWRDWQWHHSGGDDCHRERRLCRRDDRHEERYHRSGGRKLVSLECKQPCLWSLLIVGILGCRDQGNNDCGGDLGREARDQRGWSDRHQEGHERRGDGRHEERGEILTKKNVDTQNMLPYDCFAPRCLCWKSWRSRTSWPWMRLWVCRYSSKSSFHRKFQQSNSQDGITKEDVMALTSEVKINWNNICIGMDDHQTKLTRRWRSPRWSKRRKDQSCSELRSLSQVEKICREDVFGKIWVFFKTR